MEWNLRRWRIDQYNRSACHHLQLLLENILILQVYFENVTVKKDIFRNNSFIDHDFHYMGGVMGVWGVFTRNPKEMLCTT